MNAPSSVADAGHVSDCTAIVAALNSEETIKSTVVALKRSGVETVVVVDDGSVDATSVEAQAGGAVVLVNGFNRGKGYSISRAVEQFPADRYLLVDADTGDSASHAVSLLDLVEQDKADLVVGVLPSAAGRGGFGFVKRFAIRGIERACGLRVTAPLSGQRAVRGALLRDIALENRFGVEVAMTIDAKRANARVVEIPVAMEHRHTGRKLSGFVHRGRQGLQIAKALYPRIVSPTLRAGVVGLTLLAVFAVIGLSALHSNRPSGNAFAISPTATVVIVRDLTWSEIDKSNPSLVGIWGSVVALQNSPAITGTEQEGPQSARVVDSWAEALEIAKTSKAFVVIGADDAAVSTGGVRPLFVSHAAAGGGQGLIQSAETHRDGFALRADVLESVSSKEPVVTPYEPMETGKAYEAASKTAVGLQRGLAVRPLAIGAFGIFALINFSLLVRGLWRTRKASDLSDRETARGVVGKKSSIALLAMATYPYVCLLSNALFQRVAFDTNNQTALVLIVALMVAASVGAAMLIKRLSSSSWSALRWVMAASIVVICVDLLTGAKLQFGGVLGSDPALGRFYGMGNPVAVILLTAVIFSIVAAVEATPRKAEALLVGAGAFTAIGAIAALPGLGSDVGSLIVFPLVGLAVAFFQTKRVTSPRARVAAVAAAIAVIAMVVAVAVIDSLRPVDEQTHLGRLLSGSGADGTPLLEIAWRKIERNVFDYLFPLSPLLVVAVFMAFVAVWKTNFAARLLATKSPARAGTLAAMGGALAMYAANDSGVVVLALVGVFLIPFVLFQGIQALGPVEVSKK